MEGTGKRSVLIAGGGVAALEAALALRESAAEYVDIELLAPEPHFWYRPLSVVAPFELGEVMRLELDGLAGQIGVGFTPGALTGIDAWRHIAYTSRNVQIPYDMLLVACGATPFPAIPGALTFRGPADIELVEHLLEDIVSGEARSVAFVLPWGAIWSLPAYELALLTAGHVEKHGVRDVELLLVTPEEQPLQLFGPPASAAVLELLERHGVVLRASTYARSFVEGELELIPEGSIPTDRVVALPRLVGPPIDGLPQTVQGFIPVDSHCRVHGVADVFAAGDITSFTVKQGGIATQQADVAADAIAAAAGAPLTPRRFRPVLRGMLLTGDEPRYLRREISAQPEQVPSASYEPLWWPPAKIMGHYLAPFLASLTGSDSSIGPETTPGGVPVETELDEDVLERVSDRLLVAHREDDEAGGAVESLMSPDPIVVAPEDTLGEVAERFLAQPATAAVVLEFGRLLGIVTKGDLLRACARRVHPSDARVRQWMTADPIVVSATSSAAEAALLMREYAVGQLPVVVDDRVVGMLRAEDAFQNAEIVPAGLGF